MAASSPPVDQFVAKFTRAAQSLQGPAAAKRLTAIGVKAKADASKAVRGDLGDTSMSHWRRGRPIDIAARFEQDADSITVTPTPRSRGPWRVLEDGRRGGGAYDLVQVGRRRKDGTRRARSRGRNQGATRGRNTWTEATELMAKETPKRHNKALLDDVRKALKG